uniref:dolichyl-phosphooligosaccharide-protein glycotransferase n=1 Tax=uncultured marine group II/III euryarchaeote AD1000_37_E08 TaxID=1457759 RepID=A0A075FPD6_9EURY|nr:Oligosaccharyl transferase STT3 subunit family protein (STT3) [uncultured marine group II/III euryarchaeote AD1000_37_E08]
MLVALLALFFGADYAANGAMENDGYAQVLILPAVATLAAALGRTGAVVSIGSKPIHRAAITMAFVASAAFISIAYNLFESIGNLGAFTFAFVGISTFLLVSSDKREESTMLLALVIGFHLAISHAANTVMDSSTWTGSAPDLVDAERAAAASVFFAFWAVSIVAGVALVLIMRASRMDSPGSGPWFADLSNHLSRPMMATLGTVLVIQSVPLVWLGQIADLQTFFEHQYLGSVWALVTTAVILFVAFCHAERWRVIGTLVAINWALYTFGHLQEIGNEFPDILSGDDAMSTFSWFFIGFWLNVIGIMLATRGRFGDVSPRHEPSAARVWWGQHSYGIILALAIVVAFAVRTGWNVLPAMNATATGLWDMTGGSDPWYMKRVVDYIIAERSHFIFDHDRAYPMGAINPRPPLFSWSLALGGLGLSWLLEMPAEEAVWWSVAAFPAIFGALLVLPLSEMARRIHSNSAGILTAWLIALMPGHISHSTFGLADHDAFALLFLSMAFYYWVRAIEGLGTERMFATPSSNPLYLVAGIRESWRTNPRTMAYATLSGISFATVALGWKGFVYGPGILFLAFAVQIVMNMFRKRDSLPLTSAALQMLLTTFLIPLPFYNWPGLNLVFDPSGFQPMFYIIGFTIALGWVASAYRDKPWLLVLGSGTVLIGGILAILYVLQELEIYNGWDILFTGGFYFSKNKIFGTIGEAQAPSRGVLFASYGPIVAMIAVGCALVLIWRGARRERQSHLLLGIWVIVATYMAWSAGRFIFNATPAMAVVGGLGIAMMWKGANFSSFAKEWRRSGIGTPRSRWSSLWPATKKNSAVPALLLVVMLVASQHATYGIDSGIPRGEPSARDVDQTIHDIAPDFLRAELLGLSVLKSESYNPDSEMWYMGTFGPGFNSGAWNLAYDWLSEQDSEMSFSERPAFVSWWDYGFQALAQGQHPTVADNFQSGIPNSGGMLLSNSQEDTLSLFITTLAQGDRRYNGGGGFTEAFRSAISEHMSESQLSEYDGILSLGVGDEGLVLDRSMAVLATDDKTELLRGHFLGPDGIPDDEEVWAVMIGGIQMGNSTTNETEAMELYNATRLNNAMFDIDTTHYLIDDYRYTSDLIEDFNDVSTSLHRTNARLALSRAFLTKAFDMDELVDIYHGITGLEYDVQNYEGDLGEMVTRNNDIRYFAIDNRLYPLGGAYYADYQYHRGQTTGIFHAPTGLSGLDMDDYITAVYETQRGDDGPIIPRTAAEYEQEYLNDIIRQQSGASEANEIIRMVDIDYQQQPAFFDTMVARFYVGYSTSSLGLPGDAAQPAPHFYTTGTPGSYLENAYPLPGAMMNHFAVSNWYDNERCELLDNGSHADEDCSNPTIGSANTQVKVMKYYSGATIEGTVELEGFGAIPNARVMFERDAFSGEEVADENGHVVDGDDRTYWIPIGYADADEDGRFSFTAPAGKIRVSAFIGEPDLDAARSTIMMSDVSQTLNDIFQITHTSRNVNPITGILANVSGSTWLSESIVNVSGSAGHSNGLETVYANVSVSPSHATGKLVWSGAEFFDGTPLTNVSIELSPTWDRVQLAPYTVETSSGVVEGHDLSFAGIGEVTFTGEGTIVSQGIVTVTDFTGNHTQTVFHNHSLTGDGQFTGRGTLAGTVNDDVDAPACDVNSTMPENESLCLLEDGDYLLDGTVNATGRFTSNGSSTYVSRLSHATLLGSGEFTVDASEDLDSYGTINGTFSSASGEGIFGGPMVHPGTFHIVDAIPGDYDVTVIFEDGTRIGLDVGFTVPIVGTPEVRTIDIAGGSISGTLVDVSGEPLEGVVMLLDNASEPAEAVADCAESGTAPCTITPDENGDFEFGPIIPGNYAAQVDLDGDGFAEVSADYFFEEGEDSSVTFPSPVPDTSDLTFRLLEDGQNVPDLNVTLRLKNGTGGPVSAIFDNDSGEYMVELVHGTWILNHTLTEELQLWEQIEVGEDDMDSDYEFRVSRLVVGSVYYEENISAEFPEPDEGKILDYIQVEFHWGDFSTVASTNGSGGFSVVLPEGAVVDATVQLPGVTLNLVNGTRFTVTSDGLLVDSELVEHLSMIAMPGYSVQGLVSINRDANPYRSTYGGWEPVTVTADNQETEVRWHGQVAPDGIFNMVLPGGNWTFDLDADWLNPVATNLEVDGKNDSIDLVIHPLNSTLTVELFLDHSADNNASNGTYITYPFKVIDYLDSSQVVYEVLANGSEWVSDGVAELALEPGSYRIDVETSDPFAGDPFGTRIMSGTTQFDVGLNGNPVDRSIGFDPEWRMNITFTNESGGLLVDQLVRITNAESGWMISYFTDSEGRWTAHVPEGEWIVTIDAFETSPGVREILRELVTVSSETALDDISMSTGEVANFDIVLYEDHSGDVLEGISLELVSEDGLGMIHLDSTDSSGEVSAEVAPGNWNLELNMTEDRVRWIVDPSNETSFEASAGGNPSLNLTASRMVEFGGNVYWDFDDDNASDVGEGVVNVTVNISSDDTNISLLTDQSGDWAVYVPSGTYWYVQTGIEGYSSENRTVSVSTSPNTVDIELTAGSVDVSGHVSYIDDDQFATISDGTVMELIPVEGMVRDPVVPDKVLVDGVWMGNWTAQVEPGDWILRVAHEEDGLVAMGLLEADVATGGSLDLELTIGGWIHIDTEWLDYDGNSRTLADTDVEGADIVDEPELILNVGMGMRWVAPISEDGSLEMLLIAGMIDTYSEFEVIQRNLTMTYTGGQGITVSPGQEAPPAVLSHVRVANHELSAITLNSSGSDPEFNGSADDVRVLLDSEGGFEPVEFILGIEYLGHEPFDAFSIIGGTAGTDANAWLVEFHNGSGEWNTTAYFDMGLDNTMNFNNLNVRVTPANQSVAHSFEEGHSVTLTIASQDGYMYDHTVTVRIPQIHNFDLWEEIDETYGIQPGETISIGIKITNSGNGDERFEFEFDDSELPEGWVRTGATAHTLGAFIDTTHTISVSAPANASDEDFRIYMSIRDKANNTYPDIEIHVKTSMPVLSIESHQLYSGGVDAVSGQVELYSVVVRNDGLIDAQMVQLNGTLCTDLNCNDPPTGVTGTDTRDVPAGSEVVFDIALDLTSTDPKTHYIQLELNNSGFDSVEDYDSFQVKIRSPAIEETTDWIGWLLGALLLVALLLLTRGGGRRRTSAPF